MLFSPCTSWISHLLHYSSTASSSCEDPHSGAVPWGVGGEGSPKTAPAAFSAILTGVKPGTSWAPGEFWLQGNSQPLTTPPVHPIRDPLIFWSISSFLHTGRKQCLYIWWLELTEPFLDTDIHSCELSVSVWVQLSIS